LSVEIEVAYGSDLEQTCYTVLPARFAYFRADSPDGDTNTMASDDCRKVVVSKLPSDMFTAEDVTVFFESSRYCPVGGDVSYVEMNAKDHSAVVTFVDWSGRHYIIYSIRNTCSDVRRGRVIQLRRMNIIKNKNTQTVQTPPRPLQCDAVVSEHIIVSYSQNDHTNEPMTERNDDITPPVLAE